MESPQKGSHFRESPPSPRDRLRSDYVVGMAITNRMSGAITKEFRWANGLVPPASDARKSVSPVISSAWGGGHNAHGQRQRRGKRHLTPPRCPVCYTWAESVTRQSCRSQPVAICQKRPSLTLGLEIAQAPIGQANGRGVPPDIEFSVGRAMDLESVGTLVAHLISPIRFRRSGLSCQ